jgi:hypothetical protein
MTIANGSQSDTNYDIPLPKNDNWPHGKMTLPMTKPDEVLNPTDLKCSGYKNTNTAWWDSSQIYGSSEAVTQTLRKMHSDGKLQLTEEGRVQFLPRDADGNPLTGFNNNWWIGMEMLHTLFALEHNAICDMLRGTFSDWTGGSSTKLASSIAHSWRKSIPSNGVRNPEDILPLALVCTYALPWLL